MTIQQIIAFCCFAGDNKSRSFWFLFLFMWINSFSVALDVPPPLQLPWLSQWLTVFINSTYSFLCEFHVSSDSINSLYTYLIVSTRLYENRFTYLQTIWLCPVADGLRDKALFTKKFLYQMKDRFINKPVKFIDFKFSNC